jgi:DNA-binding transcriptional LysR family regulator
MKSFSFIAASFLSASALAQGMGSSVLPECAVSSTLVRQLDRLPADIQLSNNALWRLFRPAIAKAQTHLVSAKAQTLLQTSSSVLVPTVTLPNLLVCIFFGPI